MGIKFPQLEALEERLGAVLLIQVGLIMPVHPLPFHPSHHYIKSGRKCMIKGNKQGTCVCVCSCKLVSHSQ